MWQIDNRTPFAAGQSWVRGLDGAETWLIVVKATFEVSGEGTVTVAKEQPPVTRSPTYLGEPGRSSVLYENDFVLAKQTTDVIVNGTAYSPGGPVGSLDVRLQIGPVSKTLRVFGDRVWTSSGLSRPNLFDRMPIRYERAFGGVDVGSDNPDTDWYWPNPVGTGFVSKHSRITQVRPPNIEYPRRLISAWNDRPEPAGFGVIGSHWATRAAYAGTYDDAWSKRRQPLLPEDFSFLHYQSVPADQQAPVFLSGGERVVLINLVPSGVLRFALPQLQLSLETRFLSGERRDHEPPRLHTVILEPDYPRVSLVWHSAMECHADVYQLEQTRIDARDLGRPPDEEEGEEIDDLLDLV